MKYKDEYFVIIYKNFNNYYYIVKDDIS